MPDYVKSMSNHELDRSIASFEEQAARAERARAQHKNATEWRTEAHEFRESATLLRNAHSERASSRPDGVS